MFAPQGVSALPHFARLEFGSGTYFGNDASERIRSRIFQSCHLTNGDATGSTDPNPQISITPIT
jgi:hypothetical protein